MSERRIGTYDLETGEVLEGVPVWVGRKIRPSDGREWVAMNQNFLAEFTARRDVTGEIMRVFLYLNSRLDFDNLIQVPQVEIAEALHMQKQNVHRAMRWMEREGVIIRGPKVGHSSTYRLNPNAGWKGKTVNLNKAITRHLKLVTDKRRCDNTAELFD